MQMHQHHDRYDASDTQTHSFCNTSHISACSVVLVTSNSTSPPYTSSHDVISASLSLCF